MPLDIPLELRLAIRDRYLAGIADAEAKYDLNKADEDALAGAMGQAISTNGTQVFVVNGRIYLWQVSSEKIRGRGDRAPEKLLGADGIFQIDIYSQDHRRLFTKGLPFQAKKEWNRKDDKLVKQSTDMLRTAKAGIAIDFSSSGYSACRAEDVIEAKGRKKKVIDDGKIHSLGQTLGNDFLECKIGVEGLYYDSDEENFVRGELFVAITTEITILEKQN